MYRIVYLYSGRTVVARLDSLYDAVAYAEYLEADPEVAAVSRVLHNPSEEDLQQVKDGLGMYYLASLEPDFAYHDEQRLLFANSLDWL